jgi:hypothetical protein
MRDGGIIVCILVRSTNKQIPQICCNQGNRQIASISKHSGNTSWKKLEDTCDALQIDPHVKVRVGRAWQA